MVCSILLSVPTPLVHFGSFQLSGDGSHLLYIAERKKPDSASYFKNQDHLEDSKDMAVKVSCCDSMSKIFLCVVVIKVNKHE